MSLWNLFQKEKKADESTAEAAGERYERLMVHGRIAEGRVIDTDGTTLDDITQIYYVYNVNGADYESSEMLTEEQLQRMSDYAPGSKISVRYDPRQPANSIVV